MPRRVGTRGGGREGHCRFELLSWYGNVLEAEMLPPPGAALQELRAPGPETP